LENSPQYLFLASGVNNGEGFWMVGIKNCDENILEDENLLDCHRKELIGTESAKDILLAINLNLNNLLNLINEKYDVKLFGLASPLNFESSKYNELRDYELGHVKEGVGAGGISLLAFLDGFKNEEIVSLCQQNLEIMKGLGQISLEKDF